MIDKKNMTLEDRKKLEKYLKWEEDIKSELIHQYGEEKVDAYSKKLDNTIMRTSSDYSVNAAKYFDPYNKKFLSTGSKLLIWLGKKIYGDPLKMGLDCRAEEFYCVEYERPFMNQYSLSRQHAGEPASMGRNLFVNKMRSAACKDVAKITLGLSLAVVIALSVTFGTIGAGVRGIGGTYSAARNFVVKQYVNLTSSEDKYLEAQVASLKEEMLGLREDYDAGKISEKDAMAKAEELNAQYEKAKAKLDEINTKKADKEKADLQAKAEAEAAAKAKADAELEAKKAAEAQKVVAVPTPAEPAPQPIQPSAPTPVVTQPVTQTPAVVQPSAPAPAVTPQPAVQAVAPTPVVEQPKPVEPPKPAKPKMSDSEKASLKAKYMSQFQSGQISKDDMVAKIRSLNNQ